MRCMPRGVEALDGNARLSYHRWITAASVVVGGILVDEKLGRRALKTYVRVRASSSNAARVRAWAETVRYRI